jgi:hypothetical protein
VPPAEPTDRQLRASVYKVVRAYLEVERGLRAYEQLERFVTAAEYRRHRNRPCDPRLRTGRAVLPTDVGPIHLDRHLPGQITATVTTREEDQRWGALVLHFVRPRDGRWRINQLERLRRPSVARQPTPSARVDLDQRIEHVDEERRLADAAHRATTTRLTEARNTTGRRAADDVEMLEAQQRAWERRRSELDDELKSLQDRRDIQQRFPEADASPAAPATPTEPRTKQDLDQQPPARNAHQPTPAEPIKVSHRQLTAALGPLPHDDWRRRLWQGLADEIRTYRHRWKITDPRTLLGPETNDPDHQRERQELAALLRASARELSNKPRRSHDLPSDADIARSAARQYGRRVVTER